jgi:hypothetical protein
MDSVLYDVAGHRRAPATMPGYHRDARRGTRICVIRPTRRQSRRSSLSCVRPETVPTALACGH